MPSAERRYALLGGIALILEIGVCVGIASSSSTRGALLAVVLHGAVVAASAWLVVRWLHDSGVRQQRSWCFPAVLMFCLPAIGLLGVACALYLGRRLSLFATEHPMQRTEAPRLPHRPPELEKNLKFAAGGLGDILRHSGDVAKRVLAVTAASRMSEREAIPFLKLAMSDPADEVRLLAFSVKDKIETGINEKIKKNLSELPTVDARARPTVHRALAFLYWELVYLNIAEGDLRNFMLSEADEHAAACLASNSEASLHTLRGRIALERRDATTAGTHFQAALEAGADIESVATYLAEAAFIAQDFTSVAAHLERLPLHFRATAPYHALCRSWGLA